MLKCNVQISDDNFIMSQIYGEFLLSIIIRKKYTHTHKTIQMFTLIAIISRNMEDMEKLSDKSRISGGRLLQIVLI